MDSLFKSTSGKKEILDLYDQKLEELNISYESIYIETTFGRAHIHESKTPEYDWPLSVGKKLKYENN